MLEIEINLSEQWEELRFVVEKLGKGIFPETVLAVEAAVVHVRTEWMNEAARQFAFSTGKYMGSIQTEFAVAGNPLHGRWQSERTYEEYTGCQANYRW